MRERARCNHTLKKVSRMQTVEYVPAVIPSERQTPRQKRAFDVAGSLALLLVFAPLMIVAAALIRIDSPGPIFFRQARIGKDGRPFVMKKFRTMAVDAEERLADLRAQNPGGDQFIRIEDDPRITRAGRFIRRFGLDELPQLFNVLREEMSLIGPRPQTASEVALYDERAMRRLEVLPGITGLWQVSSRRVADFAEWVRLDIEYIDNWSLLLDLSIALRTPRAMLRGC